MSGAATFDTQQLLFGASLSGPSVARPKLTDHYYKHGWQIFDEIPDEQHAVSLTNSLIRSINTDKLALHKQLGHKIKLAKADHIPVCDDIVSTSYQVLHFDMGHPLLEGDPQLLITHVGIYVPANISHEVTARTRVLELPGLLHNSGLSSNDIESKLKKYVDQYGDGWSDVNTNRLACFARFLDATRDKPELNLMRDKTVGQWFQSEKQLNEAEAYGNEAAYYHKHGIDLEALEKQIALQPGQLLVLDNTRVVHGRVGRRKAKELFNFMFGVQQIDDAAIGRLRSSICSLVSE